MAKKKYKVCWHFPKGILGRDPRRTTCRTLSGKQHRNAMEAAETVIFQNPGAIVTVGRQTFKRLRGRIVRTTSRR